MASSRLLFAAALTVSGCVTQPHPFPVSKPLWVDDDRQPRVPEPEVAFSPFGWDGADNLVFRPMSDALALKTSGESINVNSVDEVPDSSWFTNRIGKKPMTPEEVARGPCTRPSPETEFPWTVTGAKVDGANPGFLVRTAGGTRYLLKFDDAKQPERATAADVVGSKLYHAAGYQVPCDQIVFFSREHLVAPAPGAKASGKPITEARVTEVLSLAPALPDGRFRAIASEILPGKVVGPWNYSGVRDDDYNDVVAHEDRREIRGSRLLAAWLNHFDARAQNTLGMWVKVSGDKGYIEHYIIDWGDCLGSQWDWDTITRRLGHTYVLDFGAMGADFFTFGTVERPWDRSHLGPAGATLGYFTDEDFDPEAWKMEYPNAAFSNMTELDGAWAARSIARMDDAVLAAVVAQARFSNPVVAAELLRVLIARRDKILDRYLSRVSSLTEPRLVALEPVPRLCLTDAAPRADLSRASADAHAAGESPRTRLATEVSGAQACVELPGTTARYLVVDLREGSDRPPARVHLAREGGAWQVVGLERPESKGPPSAVPAQPRTVAQTTGRP